MTTQDTDHLIETIYQRHTVAIDRVGFNLGAAKLSIYLALTELAERMAAAPGLAPAAVAVAEHTAVATPQDLAAPEAPAAKQRGKPGPKPGFRRDRPKKGEATAADIAQWIENGATPVPFDETGTALTGTLRREEHTVRQVNGRPVKTTRQFVELR